MDVARPLEDCVERNENDETYRATFTLFSFEFKYFTAHRRPWGPRPEYAASPRDKSHRSVKFLGTMNVVALLVALLVIGTSSAFMMRNMRAYVSPTALKMGQWDSAKVVSDKFEVVKATDAMLSDMKVSEWPTWTTSGSEKYKVGVVAPEKVYDTNELSYIISGSMEIIPKDGEAVLVQAGDFVTFPENFACNWKVIEEINKHWYCYDFDADGNHFPDV